MTTPCPISSSFPPDHDPLCDLPIHDVESPVLVIRKNNISGFGFPKIDLMDDILTSQVLKHEADRDERQQNSKTLYDASDIFPNYKGKEITAFALILAWQSHLFSVYIIFDLFVQVIARKSSRECSRRGPLVSSHHHHHHHHHHSPFL
jgi:hypothetical protein